MSYPASCYGNQGQQSNKTKAQERQAQAYNFVDNKQLKTGKNKGQSSL